MNQMFNRLKDFYNYMFYRFYKLATWSDVKFLPVYRAILGIGILQLWLIFPLVGYLELIFTIDVISSNNFGLYLIIFGIITWKIDDYCFYKDDKWKSIVKKYDTLPRNKQVLGIIAFIIVVLLVIGNLILYFSL